MANLSIKSRLLAMLLGVSAVLIAIVATIGYYSSYLALRDSVYNHLTSLRAIQAERIEFYFHHSGRQRLCTCACKVASTIDALVETTAISNLTNTNGCLAENY